MCRTPWLGTSVVKQCAATLQCRHLSVGATTKEPMRKNTNSLEHSQTPGTLQDQNCRPWGASESSSIYAALFPSWPMSYPSQMRKDEVSINPYECCPTQKFSVLVTSPGIDLSLTEGVKRSLLSLRSTGRHQACVTCRLYIMKGWVS